jgi:hypothetical protein
MVDSSFARLRICIVFFLILSWFLFIKNWNITKHAPCEQGGTSFSSHPITTALLSSPYKALNNQTRFDLALNSTAPPTIYHCGCNADFYKFIQDLLPNHKLDDKSLINGDWYGKKGPTLSDKKSNEYDVFMTDYTTLMNCNQGGVKWLFQNFKGQFIYMTGESVAYPFDKQYSYNPHRYHVFGPHTEDEGMTPNDMILTYLQITWWNTFKTVLTPAAMMDGTLRPKGNQTHFLVYGQGNCIGFRDDAFRELSTIGHVHQAGKCGSSKLNNDPTNITKVGDQWGVNVYNWRNNFWANHYQQYRFCLVMEHINQGYYVTEKIIMAFASGCIPIYYGPKDFIHTIFNEQAFVYYDINNPSPALDQVAKLEANRTLYNEMMAEPILANGNITIDTFFTFKQQVNDKLNFP